MATEEAEANISATSQVRASAIVVKASPTSNFGTGYEFDYPSASDPLWSTLGDTSTPPEKYTAPFREPVYQQGYQNKSGAYALVGLKNQQEFLEHRRYLTLDIPYLYAAAKDIDGLIGIEGTNFRSLLLVATSYGVIAEKEPYKAKELTVLPSTSSYRIVNLNELKQATKSHNGSLLGIYVDSGIFDPVDGIVAEPTGSISSAHAFVVCGWDDTLNCNDESTGALLVKSCWGKDWGSSGLAWLPYTWLDAYAFDAWALVDSADSDFKAV